MKNRISIIIIIIKSQIIILLIIFVTILTILVDIDLVIVNYANINHNIQLIFNYSRLSIIIIE